ncbi:MAG: type 1 glutamine amidotransferase [Betaproteobacteria bacterium]|jgi:GMP synthase-like glutamine amidotransferase|nr:type 1 glutamine amidotransferase [Rhodocyclaceae bacterium]MCA3132967.1 type 1 glutamine amidotransferase [Rhodocyclaceae bacterium]MCA3141954.1 type 1 glutamine amidotransferase [Rhodocyclaceae bacterium]MCA3144862.1 type 1 glutamine amidotransferase [Rhodocyclaceae bacterium]MCE2898736.1 type 1 glutamine amidotransferase [Betaproteobacteria bacterium]
MKPVAIFRHSPTEGPGHFAEYLAARNVAWKLVALDAGEAVPQTLQDFAGLVLMGGPMSVNDDLPWIAPLLSLIREAAHQQLPLLGHCLGGQLISKALGGVVTRNPTKEIGWGRVSVEDNAVARHWFGSLAHFDSFHWHGETFSLPRGATRIMSSAHCANQGFALGPHLGMQCHVEMTRALIETWCNDGEAEIAASPGPGVQQTARIRAEMPAKLEALQRVAEGLYDRWLEGLKR